MPDDNGIRAALADSREWAEHGAQLPGPAQARRRARARSTTAVTGAAVLTALAVSATLIGVSWLGSGDQARPAPAAPAQSVMEPTPSPGTPGVPTTIPDDFDLGMEVPVGDEFVSRPVERLPFDICPGEGVPALDTATDRTFEQVSGPEYLTVLGVAVFADADAAVSFMTGLRTASTECAGGIPRAEGGTREIVAEPLPGAWGDGVTMLLLDVPSAGGDPQPVIGSFLYAVRVGSSVALHYTSGENLFFARPDTIDPDVVAVERRPLDALAPRMCRWTVAGC